MMYQFANDNLRVRFEPETLFLEVETAHNKMTFDNDPAIILQQDRVLRLLDAKCTSERITTGITDGVRATYFAFSEQNGHVHPSLVMTTETVLTCDTGELRMTFWITGDYQTEIAEIAYPAPPAYDPDTKGSCTVVTNQQGILARGANPVPLTDGFVFGHDAYMPFWGQIWNGGGYMMILDTPYDARYYRSGKNPCWLQTLWRPSMGYARYPRTVLFHFYDRDDGADYVRFAKDYRAYVKTRGRFVTLREKFERCPRAKELPGRPIVHYTTAYNFEPTCRSYAAHGGDVHGCVPFDARAKMLQELYDRGLRRAYTHIDGWGVNGYDNQHPDYFPINEEAGGADGFRRLQQTTTRLGYFFGLHDQYRDYYYNARTFSFENAVLSADGTHPFCDIWDGGAHTYLCASLAPAYVRRNYGYFDALGIHIDGSYLDVFSIVEADECLNPQHPMTREECIGYRRRCLDFLSARNIIPSSEEVNDCVIPSMILCHHAPYYRVHPRDYDKYVPIPLFSLVYHDALIVPWYGLSQRDGTYAHPDEWGFLLAMLNGGTIYVDTDATREEIKLCEELMTLHRELATLEMTDHAFLDEGCRIQRSTFANGTSVCVDLDRKTYRIEHA